MQKKYIKKAICWACFVFGVMLGLVELGVGIAFLAQGLSYVGYVLLVLCCITAGVCTFVANIADEYNDIYYDDEE